MSRQWKANRLAKQDEQSDFEYREYGAPKIRPKAKQDVLMILADWEYPDISDWGNRSWKKFRKTQYKVKE